MMGVYIKGMEMQKDCRKCPMQMYSTETGKTWCLPADELLADDYRSIQLHGKPEWCPLVEVSTPHGRLIDADALVPDVCHDWNGWRVPSDDYSEECIRNAPTVIKAEGE